MSAKDGTNESTDRARDRGVGRRLAVNAASNWSNLFVTSVVTLALVPYMLGRLGSEAYGVWALLAFGLAYPVILERAFANALIRFVARCGGESRSVNRYASSTAALMFVLAVFTLAATYAVAPRLADIFSAVPAHRADEAAAVCRLVGWTLVLGMFQATYVGVLKGGERFPVYNGVMIVANLLRAGLIVLFLERGGGIVSVQTAYVLGAGTALVGLGAAAHASMAGFALRPGFIDRACTRELWRFTRHSLARSGSRVFMLNTLALFVGWRGTATDVALYDVASKVPQFLNALMFGAQNPLLPVASNLAARDDFDRIRRVVLRSVRYHAAIIGSAVLLLVLDADAIASVWLGGNADPRAGSLIGLLALSLLPSGVFGLWLPVLVGVGRLRAISAAAILTAVAAVAVAVALASTGIPVTHAPAWAMIGVFALIRGVWLPAYGSRAVGLAFPRGLASALVRPLIAVAAAAGLLALRRSVLGDPLGLAGLALDGLLVGIAVFLIVFAGEIRRRGRTLRGGGVS